MAAVLLNFCKLQGHTSDKLLKHLEEHSELLQRQMADFTAIGQDFDIVFAYETLPTQIKGAIAKEVLEIKDEAQATTTLICDRSFQNGLPWFLVLPTPRNLALLKIIVA